VKHRKLLYWMLPALFVLPVLFTSIWYWSQVRQQRLDHALIEAIKRNDTPRAIALLDRGADADATDKPYQPITPKRMLDDFWNRLKRKMPQKEEEPPETALLMTTCGDSEGNSFNTLPYNPELVKALLEHGANINLKDCLGHLPLHCASIEQRTATVHLLLERGADPNEKDDRGATPLMYTCRTLTGKDLSCLRLLVEHGADVNVTDDDGQTALIGCVYMQEPSDPDHVFYLLEHGAKVSIKDIAGHTAVDYSRGQIASLLKKALKKEQAELKSAPRTAPK
jgi:ankyrin repeat protein